MADGELDHLAELVRVQDAFLASIDEVDPGARVPWCGRWRVRDVVVHLGRIHHWAAARARRTREVSLGRGPFELAPFYAEHAQELRTALVELGPDAIGSTLLGPGPASFWRRRQLHETLVHLWDVRTAGGLTTRAPAAVWADTVDEVVTVIQPRQVRMERMPPLAVAVQLVARDAGRTWTIASEQERAPDVTVTAPAERLALMLWKRVATDDGALEVAGDADALARVVGQRITP